MNFVTECNTMSAPSSSGRYGTSDLRCDRHCDQTNGRDLEIRRHERVVHDDDHVVLVSLLADRLDVWPQMKRPHIHTHTHTCRYTYEYAYRHGLRHRSTHKLGDTLSTIARKRYHRS
jgi:hypothetical protein